MALIIVAVRGRVIRVKDSRTPNSTSMKEYTLNQKAEVTINGQKKHIADLDNGDRVSFYNGTKDGYMKVEATRDKDAPSSVKPPDLSRPKVVDLKPTDAPDPSLPPDDHQDEATDQTAATLHPNENEGVDEEPGDKDETAKEKPAPKTPHALHRKTPPGRKGHS